MAEGLRPLWTEEDLERAAAWAAAERKKVAMAEFAVGDVVCLKGSNITMCVSSVDDLDDPEMAIVRTEWFDHVGAIHDYSFDPRCLVKMEPACVIVPRDMQVIPHEGTVI